MKRNPYMAKACVSFRTELERGETEADSEFKSDKKEIFVQADDDEIDEALKKKGVEVGEAFIVDDEDKVIIDKMLKKKVKDKYKI